MPRLSEREEKFENFINKTIVLSSKKYFKEEYTKDKVEQKLIDDERYEQYIEQFSLQEDDRHKIIGINDLIEQIENINLLKALKSLSNIEMTVVFLLFEKQFTSNEESKILEICSDSVTRIKRRAIKKLKNYMKGRK